MALLEINHLSKRFGGLIAVNDLTFHVNEGEVLGLIGPNGAGKTTVFNMISGTLRPTTGTIAFNGHDIHGLVANRIARHGIVRTFQLTNLFGDMTVIENVILGSHHKSEINLWGSLFNTPSARRKEQYSTQEAEHLLDFLGLSDQREVLAKNLTHGQQRRLEIAVAMAAKPTLLLLDEPLQGMNHEEVSDMLQRVEAIRQDNKTILLVEHNMKAVMNCCDRIVVLNFGVKLAEGSPQTVMQNQEVIQAYLGVDQ